MKYGVLRLTDTLGNEMVKESELENPQESTDSIDAETETGSVSTEISSDDGEFCLESIASG